jgi:5-methylcytosine-specific restriction endonuclease McrA
MKRAFEFSELVKNQAFFRQWNRCAHCGHSLINTFDHAHHVVPNQSGNPNNANHEWLKTVDNCVILCEPCHERVHANGHYRNGAVAPPEYYPYSHGRQKQEHQAWLIRVRPRYWSI